MLIIDSDSKGDSGIFRNCALGKNFMEGNLNLPPHPNNYLAGLWVELYSSAFPLCMDLMIPFPRGKKEKQLPYNTMIFHYRLSRARQVVENAFGILVQWWRVFDRRI